MKSLKRGISILLVFMVAAFTLVGCTQEKPKETKTNEIKPEEKVAGDTAVNVEKPFEGVTLRYAVTETAAQGGEVVDLVNLVKEKTGINIEFTIMPTANDGEVDKVLISLLAGDELDILYRATPKLKVFYNAGVLSELDELANNVDYDMKKVFGENLPVFDDNQTYGLPAFNDIWLTFYNKKIFDEAGVPYPSAEGWTWDKYIETAKKLTNTEKGIWGSFMLDYDNYKYMWANQNGAEHYKADGTSNYDDAIFAEGLKFFYDLGNVEKIQPDSLTYAVGSYPWNSFVATDKIGMFVCGGWVASMLPNTEKYPRDWQAGILPMPYPEGQTPSTLAVTGNYAVPKTSKNKEAAFAAIACMAENQYTLGYGRVPARVDLTDEEIETYISKDLTPTYVNDNITTMDFKKAWFNPATKIYSEKVIGTADTAINQVWVEEGELYGHGQKSLEETVQSLKTRADQLIREALEE